MTNCAVLMDDMITISRLLPPRLPPRILPRPRLTERLHQALAYRVTVVQAGAGYGKSTALSALVESHAPLVWYHLEAGDSQPRPLLHHVWHGCRRALPSLSDAPLALLEQWETAALSRENGRKTGAVWKPVVDALANALAEATAQTAGAAPLLIILDDAHLLNDTSSGAAALDRLVQVAPPAVRFIFSTRFPLRLTCLADARLRGDYLGISQAELAFTPDDITALLHTHYGVTLSAAQAGALWEAIEGWPIALPLIGQRLQAATPADVVVAAGLKPPRTSTSTPAGATLLPDLFAYLTREVLEGLPSPVYHFLRLTAVLRQLTPEICDCLRSAGDSRDILGYLHSQGLFIHAYADAGYRYHPLFRDLLLQQLTPAEAQHAHLGAAHCYQAQGQIEEAIPHWLAAGDFAAAAAALADIGRDLVRAGRLEPLSAWLNALPPDHLTARPALLILLGDIARLHSRFDAALGWYQQAEEHCRLARDRHGLGQALRSQARVYLDTVNPSQAEALLQEALRLSDGQEDRESRARLLELLAENLLNQGRPAAAEQRRQQAQALRQAGPDAAELPTRLLLRTGQIHRARALLEQQAAQERLSPIGRPRAHRETSLLLSLILSMQGEQAQAHQAALEGAARGESLKAPFVTAVALMRQGHAWMLHKDSAGYAAAERCFLAALEWSYTLDIPRLRVEADWGLCQVYGFQGQLERARQVAADGITLAQAAGDEWVAACIRVTLGAGYVLTQQWEQAAHWLTQAGHAFRECSDSYGQALALLWSGLMWHATHDAARLQRDLETLLRLSREHDYAFLFQRPTLLGPPDPRRLVPLLLYARQASLTPDMAAYAHTLLEHAGLGKVDMHPGYQLRIQTMGAFRLWRGTEEAPARAWRRQKARQLFLLFLTHRRRLIHREQIIDILWPDQPAEEAGRDFKIAYNALCQVLEPARARNAPSAYIVRDGPRYGLRPEADVWLDVALFDELTAAGDRQLQQRPAVARDAYRQALALYHGTYLQEFPYLTWADQERQRLLNGAIRSAERLARSLAQEGLWDEAIEVCQAALTHDNCCEPAYQILIQAHIAQGNPSAARRIYQQCVATLERELSLPPTPATQAWGQSIQ